MGSIDVAIPNYNYGRFLRACVESVTAQDVDALRILIIDNASTDGSQEIARELAARHPNIELRLKSENEGPHASFNDAIDWARSDYFVILCSDDMLPRGALKRAAAVMDAMPDVNLVYGRTEFFETDAPETGEAFWPAAWRRLSGGEFLDLFCRTGSNPLDGPTAMVRTAVQKEVGYYRSALTHTDDMEMWMRFSCTGAVAEINAVQTLARVHGANSSAELRGSDHWIFQQEAAFELFFAREGAFLPDAPRTRRKVQAVLARRAYLAGFGHLLRGEAGGIELMRFALSRMPILAVLPPVGALFKRADAWQRISAAFSVLARRIGGSATS